jgi:phosphate transport system substrate-binding protein
MLENSYKWNCDLKQFDNRQREDGKVMDAGPEILDALKHDRYAIAFSKFMYRNDSVKPLALGETLSGPYVAPTRESVGSHAYPLTRTVMVYLNRPPGRPLRAIVQAFLL